jgi:hypothetical protein
MASNTQLSTNVGTGDLLTTKERTHDGDATKQPVTSLAGVSGTEGAYTHVDIQAGAGTAAAALRSTLASDDPAVVALQVMDDWDESDRAKVNVIVGQAGITAGAGAVAANTPRTTLASDDPAVTALQVLDNIVGTEDAAAPAGVAQIGGRYDSSARTLETGDIGAIALNASGQPLVEIAAGGIAGAVHDAAVASEGIQQMLDARSADPTAVTTADAVRALATQLGKQVFLPYAIPASTWSYASAAAVTDTADDEAKAAGAAGVRHYITGIQVFNGHDTTGTEVVIKDGSTVIWRGWAEQTGGGASAKFDPPLRGTAATAVNVANIANSSSTYFNLQGFSAAE